MPTVLFRIRWPDGIVERCYSPSTIIKTYFTPGRDYPLSEFLALAREGLNAASERVRIRYGGTGCSNAMAQLAAIEAKADRQMDRSSMVHVEAFEE